MNSDIKKSYSVIYFILAGLHFLYLGIFLYTHSTILVYFNAFSIFVFLMLGVTASHAKSLVSHFMICFFAIMINAVLSSILCGMACGFSLLLLANLPLVFYSVFVLYKKNHKNTKVVLIDSGALIFLCYMIWLADYTGFGRKYNLGNSFEHILYVINLTITVLVMMGFLFMFVSKFSVERETLEQEKEAIETSANYDPLTKLLNRRSLDKYFTMAIQKVSAYDSDFSILMCDIDNFKHVNDTYGHDCGDQVLKNIASIIKNTIRSEDVAFRWGGEEMLILIHAKGHIAKEVAERCRKSIEASSVMYNGQEIKVTITIGGASYYQGATKDDLVSKADGNLYTGKNNGKNQVVM